MANRPHTLGELKASGYVPLPVKQEMRNNLIRKLRGKEKLFPGIVGYDDTVIPQVVHAVLSQHDMLFLGLRGQGKTRMLRMLTGLLDDAIPVVADSEINDDPFHPLSKLGRDVVAAKGDDTPVRWIGRDERYHEKLATPDVTIADLIGEVDLIKHAEGRHLADEAVMHFGLIPRSHRGIFCMNELPDLSPKIQVGLFNVLEERDIQIRGFTIRLPLDVCLVFSANPEDYTNRGRIVTPLKDRIGSVIRTHYPRTRELGKQITEEQAGVKREGMDVHVPEPLRDIVEEISRLARTSPHVNQASGVSVRMSIANYENLISSAERRALGEGGGWAVPRLSDLFWLVASSRGKLELSLTEDTGEEDGLIVRIIEEAIKNVFDERLTPKKFGNVVEHFSSGQKIEVSAEASAAKSLQEFDRIKGFSEQIRSLAAGWGLLENVPQAVRPEILAGVGELVLEGLYGHNRLTKKPGGVGTTYSQ